MNLTSHLPSYSRRDMLKQASCGFGYLALAGLCAKQATAAASASPLSSKPPHFAPKAKRVIFMFHQGGPSHVDTFDYKPQLAADDGKTPDTTGFYKGGKRTLLKSPFKFSQHGDSGLWMSELFPNLAKHADKLCLLNS